ncbi:CocE/NonD family hydrolase [Aurantiacibacter rhizosphaerae]|uniref:CocE/NonD family hydrolase n=1 Tax=Aurantiacibacter rhizosphaerae TaxID=2691582 RepID=A0A844XGL1_9SPHN|nr:CocE/NonD family hydrolase [Aurantiacibacter rhizosphaerae]MWV28665.1 CocE/NonD family hydrolase [Aurantiacibacter rhizosphaerae]
MTDLAPQFRPIMRPGVDPASAPHKPPLPPAGYRQEKRAGLLFEQNLPVVLRDGTEIYADIYRPEGATDLPVLLSWSPYGKHAKSNQVFWPPSGVNPEWLSPETPFEGPDPVFWCAAGYAVAIVDPRGAWLSGGDFHHNGEVEALDCFDTIDFLASRPWASGSVGMTGVSYLACIQYLVAPLDPPALKAINPWEGFSDWYREFAFHGGIPETGFAPRASDNIQYSLNRTENTWANIQAHPLHNPFWQSKELALDRITQPAYVVASWADQALHTRGTLEAFRQMQSQHKWLEVHGQKKWAHYYLAESRKRRRDFFDHFLKAKETSVMAWPKVRLEVRESFGKAQERTASEWPLPQTEYLALNLDSDGTMSPDAKGSGTVEYSATDGEAVFDHTFAHNTELTGYAKLVLDVEARGSDDMDLFVALEKLDRNGEKVGFGFYAFFENGPVALGWLRASHRALDPQRSTMFQPFHPHDREERLKEGESVQVEIEIWPSSTHFGPGETLRLIVKGRDIYDEGLPNLPFARHEDLRNAGTHILHCANSYLQVPNIPLEKSES